MGGISEIIRALQLVLTQQVHLATTLIMKANSSPSHLFLASLSYTDGMGLLPSYLTYPDCPSRPSILPENVHFHKSFVKNEVTEVIGEHIGGDDVY